MINIEFDLNDDVLGTQRTDNTFPILLLFFRVCPGQFFPTRWAAEFRLEVQSCYYCISRHPHVVVIRNCSESGHRYNDHGTIGRGSRNATEKNHEGPIMNQEPSGPSDDDSLVVRENQWI